MREGMEDLNVEAYAPGWQGIPARWTSSAKTGLAPKQPRLVHAEPRHHERGTTLAWIRRAYVILGSSSTDRHTFFSEEKRDSTSKTIWIEPGVPPFRLLNTCRAGQYRIEKEIVTDPRRDVVLQQTRFVSLTGSIIDYRLYVLLSPHLGSQRRGEYRAGQ
jgi:glucoamylase